MTENFSEEAMYDDFGLYTMYYYHTFGFDYHWVVSIQWRMFRAVFEGNDDEFGRLQDSFRYGLVRQQLGGWN